MMWTFIALIVSLILTAIGVLLAIKYFDRPSGSLHLLVPARHARAELVRPIVDRDT
jgi:hypothetical protein